MIYTLIALLNYCFQMLNYIMLSHNYQYKNLMQTYSKNIKIIMLLLLFKSLLYCAILMLKVKK